MLKCNRKTSGHDCYADVGADMGFDYADLLPSFRAEDLNVDERPAHSSQQVLATQDHRVRARRRLIRTGGLLLRDGSHESSSFGCWEAMKLA